MSFSRSPNLTTSWYTYLLTCHMESKKSQLDHKNSDLTTTHLEFTMHRVVTQLDMKEN